MFDFLSENYDDWHFLKKNHIYILDCIGKFQIIRWAEILKKLNIPFGIIHDIDIPSSKNDHEAANNKIEELYSPSIIAKFNPNIEGFLNINKDLVPKEHEHSILLYLDESLNLKELMAQHPSVATAIQSSRANVKTKISELQGKIKTYFNNLLNSLK